MARLKSRRRLATSLTIAALLIATTGNAAVYKSVDGHGTTTYSDRPSPEAHRLELPQVSIVTFSTPPAPTRHGKTSSTSIDRGVSILVPVQDATVRSNAGTVAVELSVDPKLDPGSTLTLLLDGEPVHKDERRLALPLVNVDRGTHSLQAIVVGGSGRELARSPSVTFHLQRVAILTAPAF